MEDRTFKVVLGDSFSQNFDTRKQFYSINKSIHDNYTSGKGTILPQTEGDNSSGEGLYLELVKDDKLEPQFASISAENETEYYLVFDPNQNEYKLERLNIKIQNIAPTKKRKIAGGFNIPTKRGRKPGWKKNKDSFQQMPPSSSNPNTPNNIQARHIMSAGASPRSAIEHSHSSATTPSNPYHGYGQVPYQQQFQQALPHYPTQPPLPQSQLQQPPPPPPPSQQLPWYNPKQKPGLPQRQTSMGLPMPPQPQGQQSMGGIQKGGMIGKIGMNGVGGVKLPPPPPLQMNINNRPNDDDDKDDDDDDGSGTDTGTDTGSDSGTDTGSDESDDGTDSSGY